MLHTLGRYRYCYYLATQAWFTFTTVERNEQFYKSMCKLIQAYYFLFHLILIGRLKLILWKREIDPIPEKRPNQYYDPFPARLDR